MSTTLNGNNQQIQMVNAEVTPAQSAIGKFIDNLDRTADNQTNALSRQNEIQTILRDETARLANKKKAIDDAMKAQGRIIFFNDNSRKWYAAYLKIILIIVVILAIIFALKLLSENFSSIIPFWILQLAFIIVITVGFITIFSVYSETARHSRYNYDELNLTSPDVGITDPDTDNSNTLNMNGLAGKFCVDNSCCDEGTTWNGVKGKCIPDSRQPFTTLNRVSPTEAFEYTEYAPYK